MPYTCKICENDPLSHSFKNIGTINNISYYYTRPSEATRYNDVVGITEHYDGVLSENKNAIPMGTKPQKIRYRQFFLNYRIL